MLTPFNQMNAVDLDAIERIMSQRRLIDFARFAWPYIEPGQMQSNWHIECMADHLEAISKRQIKRLIINLPPRHMKSVLANVIWPAWTWAQDTALDDDGNWAPLAPGKWMGPGVKFTFMSYAQELSTRDSVKCRQLIDSPWFQRLFGDRFAFSSDQNQKTRFTNDKNGFRMSLSFQGRITGEGADIFCLPAGVMIETEMGPLPIDEIVSKRLPLRVWSFNHATGQTELKRVESYETNPAREVLTIKTELGIELVCTVDHSVWVVGRGYVQARDVRVGDTVLTTSSRERQKLASEATVLEVAPKRGLPARTFNLAVADNRNYIANGVLVHNCIDDPHNIKDVESPVQREDTLRTWDEVIPTRLNDPHHGVFLIIMQRSHDRDLTGHILAREKGWTHLVLPAEYDPSHPHKMLTPVLKVEGEGAGKPWTDPRQPGELLWNARFDKDVVSEWKARLGSYASAGQLQQRPVPREGGLFKIGWMKPVRAIPAGYDRVRAWDLAGTESSQGMDPDWTVGVLMTVTPDRRFFIEDIQRFRASPHQTRQMVLNQAIIDGKRTHIRLPQDPGQGGKYQADDYVKMLAGYSVKAISFSKNPGNKEMRATPLAAQCEAGNVYYLEGAPWARAMLDEMALFPNGQHDDVIDAMADAFASLALMKRRTVIAGGGI